MLYIWLKKCSLFTEYPVIPFNVTHYAEVIAKTLQKLRNSGYDERLEKFGETLGE